MKIGDHVPDAVNFEVEGARPLVVGTGDVESYIVYRKGMSSFDRSSVEAIHAEAPKCRYIIGTFIFVGN